MNHKNDNKNYFYETELLKIYNFIYFRFNIIC